MRGEKRKTSAILRIIYDTVPFKKYTPLKDWIGVEDAFVIGPGRDLRIVFDPHDDAAYTFIDKRDRRCIKIGGKLIKNILDLPDEMNKTEVLKTVRPIQKAAVALNFHEVAHNVETDMVSKLIANYPKPQYIPMLHDLNNICEDVYAEPALAAKYKVMKPTEALNLSALFKWFSEITFGESAKNYTDNGSLKSFFNYILLILRLGKDAVPNENAVFEKYKENLIPQFIDILTETHKTRRLEKEIALGEWMIDNITEFKNDEEGKDEFAKVDHPSETLAGSLRKTKTWAEGSDDSDEMGDSDMPDGPSEMSKKMEKEIKKAMKKLTKSLEDDIPKPEESEEESEDKTSKALKESEEESDEESDEESEEESEGESEDGVDEEESEEESEEPEDIFDDEDEVAESPDLDALYDSNFDEEEDHQFIKAKDVYTFDPQVLEKLWDTIQKYDSTIDTISKVINTFTARKVLRTSYGHKTGRIDVPSVMKSLNKGGIDVRVFKRPGALAEAIDAALYILGDNSGSMYGIKSILCAIAMIVLAQVAENAHIPFECSCFTKVSDGRKGGDITIIEKGFEDTLESSLPYMAINNSDLLETYLDSDVDTHTFSGNTEEVNLYYVWQKFRQRPEKTKILFVICDGETTGDRVTLKNIVKQIKDDNIIVIGIGVQCEAVKNIYQNNNRIFNSEKELEEQLAPYLVETLTKYIVR